MLHVCQVVREFRALRAGGVREISLIAQDLGDFGKDFGKDSGGVPNVDEDGEDGVSASSLAEGTPQLIKLLNQILAAEEAPSSPSDSQHEQQEQAGVLPSYWLRLLYLYPDEITPQLLDVMKASQGKIAPYIDMPIQVKKGEIWEWD